MAAQHIKMQTSTDHFITDKREIISDGAGFEMNLTELSFGDIGLRWGEYVNPVQKSMTFPQNKESVVSHFQMFGSEKASGKDGLREKQFIVYRESVQSHQVTIAPTKNTPRSFFELIMRNDFFGNFISEESNFLRCFKADRNLDTFSKDFISHITPEMYSVISQMQNAPYHGSLKKLYLEAKSLELFLMQVSQIDNHNNNVVLQRISGADLERLYYIRDYINLYFSEALSIISLSRAAGINSTKLKSGFKSVFKITVFGYISHLRLTEAKRLILEEKMQVSEAAYQVGFKYPHHFSAAFKKKFGILPTSLRS